MESFDLKDYENVLNEEKWRVCCIQIAVKAIARSWTSFGTPSILRNRKRANGATPKRILHQFDSIPCKMNPFTLFMVALAAVAVAQTVSGPHSLAPPFNSFTWSGTFPALLRNR